MCPSAIIYIKSRFSNVGTFYVTVTLSFHCRILQDGQYLVHSSVVFFFCLCKKKNLIAFRRTWTWLFTSLLPFFFHTCSWISYQGKKTSVTSCLNLAFVLLSVIVVVVVSAFLPQRHEKNSWFNGRCKEMERPEMHTINHRWDWRRKMPTITATTTRRRQPVTKGFFFFLKTDLIWDTKKGLIYSLTNFN